MTPPHETLCPRSWKCRRRARGRLMVEPLSESPYPQRRAHQSASVSAAKQFARSEPPRESAGGARAHFGLSDREPRGHIRCRECAGARCVVRTGKAARPPGRSLIASHSAVTPSVAVLADREHVELARNPSPAIPKSPAPECKSVTRAPCGARDARPHDRAGVFTLTVIVPARAAQRLEIHRAARRSAATQGRPILGKVRDGIRHSRGCSAE